MKRIELYHPRVFDDPGWARKYYKGNAWSIRMMARRLVGILRKSGFQGGRVLDSGCGFGVVALEIARSSLRFGRFGKGPFWWDYMVLP